MTLAPAPSPSRGRRGIRGARGGVEELRERAVVESGPSLDLIVLPGRLAVCRLDVGADVPAWATTGDFSVVARTAEEVSIVCAAAAVPPGVRAEGDWRALRVAGQLDFALIGVLAALTASLAEAAVPVFVISTFDTDYLLVREVHLHRAINALAAAGHRLTERDGA